MKGLDLYNLGVEFTFTAQVIEWRGPAPFYFIPAPAKLSPEIKEIASNKSYGWGVLHAMVEIKGQSWKTALFPKDGLYLVPLKMPTDYHSI